MQKYVKNEKRYRLINFICLLAVYKKLIGTGRVLGTSILRYDCTDEVRVKVSSFQNYNIKLHRRSPSKGIIISELQYTISSIGRHYGGFSGNL